MANENGGHKITEVQAEATEIHPENNVQEVAVVAVHFFGVIEPEEERGLYYASVDVAVVSELPELTDAGVGMMQAAIGQLQMRMAQVAKEQAGEAPGIIIPGDGS